MPRGAITNWLTIRPRVEWRGKRRKATEQTAHSRFRTQWGETVNTLYREISRLVKPRAVATAILALDVPEAHICQDGSLRANARPVHSGIQLFIESKHGPLEYQCDLYRDWQDNVRAVALTLERLRKAELYGCVKRGEQYVGFRALPGPANAAPVRVFAHGLEACQWLIDQIKDDLLAVPMAESILEDRNKFDRLWKHCAKKLHPDSGGNAQDFHKATLARELIEADFK